MALELASLAPRGQGQEQVGRWRVLARAAWPGVSGVELQCGRGQSDQKVGDGVRMLLGCGRGYP